MIDLERGGSTERVEVPLSKSVFRAALARVAALCDQLHPDSVSPFDGRGELSIDTDPPETIRAVFENTPERQILELTREGWAQPHEIVNLD